MNGLIDLHLHILPGLDHDGPPDLEQSLLMAEELVKQGFAAVVATPHFFEGAPAVSEILDSCQFLTEALARRKIPLKVLPGAEAAIDPRLLQRLRKGQVLTLNRGPYLLIELPLFQEIPPYTDELLFELKAHGYQPVLAHPERVKAFQSDLSLLHRLVARGLYTQFTLSAFSRLMGPAEQKTACRALAHHLVHFVATDAHSESGRLLQTGPALAVIRKQAGPAALETLLKSRPGRLLRGEDLEIPEPLPIRRSRLNLIKEKVSLNRKRGVFHG